MATIHKDRTIDIKAFIAGIGNKDVESVKLPSLKQQEFEESTSVGKRKIQIGLLEEQTLEIEFGNQRSYMFLQGRLGSLPTVFVTIAKHTSEGIHKVNIEAMGYANFEPKEVKKGEVFGGTLTLNLAKFAMQIDGIPVAEFDHENDINTIGNIDAGAQIRAIIG
jgi:phage tail tube protein FII